ncbi:MAG: epimerase [Pseudomonadota bacterium]
MQPTALILGGSGRFGRHAHIAFRDAGWRVRLFDRSRDSLWDAAWGASAIVNGWNPAYADWARHIPAYMDELVEVAEATGAVVLQPGNIYNFGPDVPDLIGPNTPQLATNGLGRVRVQLEARWRRSSARVIVLRAGDFLDTEKSGNWFDRIIAAKVTKGVLTYPGRLDATHTWAWLPDLARAGVALVERASVLPRFADVPFRGYTMSGLELARAMSTALGAPIDLRKMSWAPVQLAAPFWPMGRHLCEIRYLWDTPHSLSDAELMRYVPEFRVTPVEDALRLAVQDHIHPHQPMARRRLYVGRARIV